jgi:multiple antibiotic resistance protein
MSDILIHIATVFMGFFAIMNPIANVPIFLGLTADDDPQTTKAIAFRALPILAGPGTIATAMSFSAYGGIAEMIVTIAAFAVLCVITYVLFIFGGKFVTFVGVGILGVITRLMGLILAVIGIQMVIEGVKAAFHLT